MRARAGFSKGNSDVVAHVATGSAAEIIHGRVILPHGRPIQPSLHFAFQMPTTLCLCENTICVTTNYAHAWNTHHRAVITTTCDPNHETTSSSRVWRAAHRRLRFELRKSRSHHQSFFSTFSSRLLSAGCVRLQEERHGGVMLFPFSIIPYDL